MDQGTSDGESEMDTTSISESSGESEDDTHADEDANLTVEQLRQKYADALNQEASIAGSDEEDDDEMDVDNDEINRDATSDLPNGDVSVDGLSERVKRGGEVDIPDEGLGDDNSIFDEDEDDDSPMDSEEDVDSDE